MDVNQDGIMIQRLLDFKEKLDTITNQAFTGASDAKEAVKKSFQVFINKRNDKPAELVAKFIDAFLRKKSVGSGVDRIVDQLMVLFRYIQGKDVFEAFYQKDLARRLLLGKLASQDTELNLVRLLKVECGMISAETNIKRRDVYAKA
jgi:cullin-4